METSRNDSVMLVAAVIGAAVLGSQPAASLGYGVAAVGDAAILLTLFGFDSGLARTDGQSLAFAGAGAFCLLTPFRLLADALSPAADGQRPNWLMVGVWVAATVLLFALDRFRMASRESVSLAGAGLAGPAKPFVVSQAPASAYRPAPIRVEPKFEQAAMPVVVSRPAETPAVQAAVMTPMETAPAAAAVVVPPSGDVTNIPPGREALIYLNLVGEGLNVLRTVRAENLGRDYYRIADVMPEGEQWEFTPGQVVRCRKKSLSNGKQMVAYEEAPRAH